VQPDKIDDDWILARLDSIWPAHTSAFAHLLIDLRRQFDGDLDAVLILATVSAGSEGADWRTTLLSGRSGEPRINAATNTQSIAHVSGIPRESVRRKLSRLEKKGWVSRDSAGNWSPRQQAANDLRPATLATIGYLQTVFYATQSKDHAPKSDEDRTRPGD